MFNLFRKKNKFFTDEEHHAFVKAIRHAEKKTSGEIRLYIESKCKNTDPLTRAARIFYKLKMQKTEHRNGVLIYVATTDKKLAIFGDEGIFKAAGEAYWNDAVNEIMDKFSVAKFSEGIINCIIQLGETLHKNFPYNREVDKNELPDEIVLGR